VKQALLSFLLPVSFIQVLLAQSPLLKLRNGLASTTAVERERAHLLFSDQADAIDGRLIRCLLFDHTLKTEERESLSALDVRFLSPLRPHAWVVSLPAGMNATALFDRGLIALHVFDPLERTDHRLHEALLSGKGPMDVVLVPWKGSHVDLKDLVDRFSTEAQPHGSRGALHVRADASKLQRLIGHPLVQWVEPLPEAGQPEDLRGRAYHRVNRLGPVIPNGSGLDGEGVVVVVNDDGFVGPHIDFKGRTEQSAVIEDVIGDHGDMVAGIIGAAGNLDPRATGMAPACDLVIAPYIAELPATVSLHQDSGAVIFNSSYSNGCNAGYTEITQQIDQEVIDNPAILQVFSAGNEGDSDCDYGAGEGWGNITGGHKIGKNVIATANLTDQDGLVNSSSRGPSADGRIKPDISAFGNGQQSNASSNLYMSGSGTSAAAPGIAGVAALLYQGWRTLNGSDPPSALVKAFLLNTADDLGNTGPDYKYGWGAVNGERAWRAMLEDRWMTVTVDDGSVETIQIDVPADVKELRVMAYWMDPTGELLAANALVNDVDLAGISPIGNAAMPWRLSIDPDPTALDAPAIRADEHLNNVEQVMVVDPIPGTWNFPIYGFDIPTGPQQVFIVYEFLFPGMDITWPGHGERLAANATHRFRWDTPDRSTPVTAAYSINGGNSWASFPLPTGQRYFDLGIGDTVLTDLRFRVEQGSWSDERIGITTMRTPVDLSVTVNCVDSALLEWPTLLNAQAYIVHKLGDRYMVNVDTITTTSHWFTGLSAIHDDWFAVTAVGPAGIIGERSIAIPRPQELIGCLAQEDLIIEEVLAPSNPVISCQPVQTLTVRVRNNGLQTINGFTLGARGADSTITETAVAVTIAPGNDTVVSFPGAQLALEPGEQADLMVWATSANESYTLNDSLAFSLYVHDLTTQYPYAQDFEAMPLCTLPGLCDELCPLGDGLANGLRSVEDSLDWRVDANGTNTTSTGPDVDHTLGSAQGRYVYMESTGGCFGAGDAHLILPCFTVPAGPVALMYWYHMYGAGIDALHVDLMVNGSWQLDAIPPMIGDQGNSWFPGMVDLSPFEGATVNVRFRGARGASHFSDIALDDIHISSAIGVDEIGGDALIVHPGAMPGTYVLRLPKTSAGTVTIRDVQGRIIRERALQNQVTVAIDLADQASGIYVLTWADRSQRYTARLIR
jgi:Subtilase family/MAM domain, meprin/A5/mu